MLLHYLKAWWQSPGGGREVFQIALPLVISTSSWTLMYFIDRVFLGWYDPDTLAASLPAGMLSFVLVCFFLGVASYVNTFVAQYHGARHPERIGLAVWQGVWVGVITVPVALLAIPLAPAVFALVGHAPHLQALEVRYFQLLQFGLCAMVFSSALSSFFTGRGKVRTVMIVDILAALVNVVLDYAWILGKWGFPAMGIEGAAYATVAAHWFQAGLFFMLFLRPSHRAVFGTLSGLRFDPDLFRRLLRYGCPSGVQVLLDVSAFTIFVMFIGRLGPLELTVTNVAFNINNLGFIPMLGVGIAATTLVGQRLGENRPDLAARSTWSAFGLATCYVAFIGSLYLFAPDLLLMIHGAQMDPARYAELRDTGAMLLRFVALYCLFDTMIIVFVGALKGAGDTRFILFTSLTQSTLLALASWFAIEWFRWGLFSAWAIITLTIMVVGCVYMLRFVQGKWRDMRVIESQYVVETLPVEPIVGPTGDGIGPVPELGSAAASTKLDGTWDGP